MEKKVPQASDLTAAFDAALSLVQRSIATGMTTIDGAAAREHLARLQQQLVVERQRATECGSLDGAWLQSTVRWVTEWAPDSEISIIAALGRIARADRAGS
jgi:hypothetical protein